MSLSSGNGVSQINSKPNQTDIIIQALCQYSEVEIEQLFLIHTDPVKNKLVLTEQQFNLVRKVYLKAF